jgi:CubicO group peptidase (beta-lactamase class C family)
MESLISRRQFLARSTDAAVGCALLSAAAQASAAGTGEDRLPTEERFATLAARIPVLMEQAAVPGLSIAVVRNARLVWSQAFGVKNATSREAVGTDTVFEAASLSKPVFAFAVMQRCEQGLIDLDRPLAESLPEPYVADEPRLSLITARRVLCHTTGFPNWRRGQPLALRFTPGERFGYSGEGYVYLQRVLERLTGESLAEHMQMRALKPFGMRDSSYRWTEAYETQAATGHDREGKPREKEKPAEANAAYTLHTTPSDFATFVTLLLRPSKKGPDRLGEASVRDMLKPHVSINRYLSWGLGWGIQQVDTGETFWHWGSNSGFKSFVVASRPKKSAVVVMTNSDNGLRICKEIVVAAIGGEHPAFAWSGVDL